MITSRRCLTQTGRKYDLKQSPESDADHLQIKNGTFDSCNVLTCPSESNLKIISQAHDACVCIPTSVLTDFSIGQVLLEGRLNKILINSRRSEGILLERETEDPDFTYIPPPKTDITPELLAQSLANQPQDTATIVSVMPYFSDDVIQYGAQMNGFVASTLSLNASTELPCDGIGSPAQPADLELRPKDIDNGTAQAHIPDCSIVAVNMYNPNVINYWVQTRNGTMHSLVGSNKIVNIDQLNTTASVSLVVRAKSLTMQKRDLASVEGLEIGRAIAARAIERKAVVPPDPHTASMTAEACAAITCNNNGGQPAVYNQFTKMCGCREPSLVEIDHSS